MDDWGGGAFKAGDILGFGITLTEKEKAIRFFKNGVLQGSVGGSKKNSMPAAAFQIKEDEQNFYYPAFSCYGGGRGRANFGPKFVFPPNNKDLAFKPFNDLVVIEDMEAAEAKLSIAVKNFKNLKVKVVGGESGEQALLNKDPNEVMQCVVDIMKLKWCKVRWLDFQQYNTKAFEAMLERSKRLEEEGGGRRRTRK